MKPVSKQQKLLIEMVMRQTIYSYDDAKRHLDENDNNYIRVIKDSFGLIEQKKTEPITSINQHIYKEIRGFMDTASNRYILNQEQERKKQEVIEIIKKKQMEKNKQKKEDNKEDNKKLSNIEEDIEGENN